MYILALVFVQIKMTSFLQMSAKTKVHVKN